jgi:hypothetical protein
LLPAEEGEESVVRCKRCELISEPKRPVSPETGICLWCEKEIEGEDLRVYCESGQAVEQLGGTITRAQVEEELQKVLDKLNAKPQPSEADPTTRSADPLSRLLGQPYEKALAELESRCRTVIHGLATLGIGCVRLDDDGLLEMVAGFYHPSLPMLRIPPRQRLRSLMAGSEDTAGS